MAEQAQMLDEHNGRSEDVAGPHVDGQCTRCGGLMVAERYIDMLDDTGQLEFTAARCIQCGEVVDQTILRNRQASQAQNNPLRLANVA